MAYRTDRAQLRTDLRPPEKRPDGSTRYHGAVTKAGVFEYELEDGSKRFEYRPPEEVSRADSLETLQLAPVVAREHTPKGEARKRSVGTVGQDVSWVPDKGEVQASVVVRDDSVNSDIASGMQELSCGYDVDLDETPGVTPDGKRYDAIQRGPMLADGKRGPITYEHLAIVPSGRAGSEVRLRADSKTSRPSWRTDSARMISAAAPGGDAAINDSAATGRSKEAAMADKKNENGTRADCGDMSTEPKKDAVMGAMEPDADEKTMEALAAENKALKEQLAKMQATSDAGTATDSSGPPAAAMDPEKDPAKRMDSAINAAVERRFAREKLEKDATAVGVTVRNDQSDDAIKIAVIEKLNGKAIPQERRDSKDATYRSAYLTAAYDLAMETNRAALDAEARARGGAWVPPGQRADSAAVNSVGSAYAKQEARNDARSKGASK